MVGAAAAERTKVGNLLLLALFKYAAPVLWSFVNRSEFVVKRFVNFYGNYLATVNSEIFARVFVIAKLHNAEQPNIKSITPHNHDRMVLRYLSRYATTASYARPCQRTRWG